MRRSADARTTFDKIYQDNDDPWESGSARYRYQDWKYDRILECLPVGRRFHRALDLGCGIGLLSTRLARRADNVLGVDIADAAVARATATKSRPGNLSFQQGDILDLPTSLNGTFDLVVIADTIYYLADSISSQLLASLTRRVAELLVPGGVCLLANHYFFHLDPDSRVSRRIHTAFSQSEHFHPFVETWRPFYLVSGLTAAHS